MRMELVRSDELLSSYAGPLQESRGRNLRETADIKAFEKPPNLHFHSILFNLSIYLSVAEMICTGPINPDGSNGELAW